MTPGGGGLGEAKDRDPALGAADEREERLSASA